MDFGKAIKTIRTAAGITQEEFAQKVGISQTWLSKLETGAKVPEHEMIKQIGDAYMMPENFIYLMAMDEDDYEKHHPGQKQLFRRLKPVIDALIEDVVQRVQEEDQP